MRFWRSNWKSKHGSHFLSSYRNQGAGIFWRARLMHLIKDEGETQVDMRRLAMDMEDRHESWPQKRDTWSSVALWSEFERKIESEARQTCGKCALDRTRVNQIIYFCSCLPGFLNFSNPKGRQPAGMLSFGPLLLYHIWHQFYLNSTLIIDMHLLIF